MTVGAKLRRNTTFTVSFPELAEVTLAPREVELYQCAGKHDVCTIRFAQPNGTYFEQLETSTAVVVRWTQDGREREWLGYVSHVKKPTNASLFNEIEVVCLGTSFVLKQSIPLTFSNLTFPEVASRIATKYSMRFDGQNHPRRLVSVATSGETYWEFLNDMAQDIGYVFYVDNTVLVYKPINSVIEKAKEDVPLLEFWGQGKPATDYGTDRTLDSLEYLYGDYIDDGHTLRVVKRLAGVEPITGKIVTSTSTPETVGTPLRSKPSDVLFEEQLIDTPVANRVTAKEFAEGHAQLARFTIPARMQSQGDPRIRPHSLVYVKGVSSKADGYWYVRSVRHILKAGGLYGCEITAATDGVGGVSALGAEYQRKSQKDKNTYRKGVGKLTLESYIKGNSFETVTVKLPKRTQTSSEHTLLRTTNMNKVSTTSVISVQDARTAKSLTKWRTTKPKSPLRKVY